MNIEQGNADDVSFIARWLKEEWDRDGMGLWNNWEGIYKRTTEGKFLVCRVAGEPIGFYAYCGKGFEPPRFPRRPFHLSHAASFCSLSMA